MNIPLPDHRAYSLHPRNNRVALLIGVLNEGEQFTRQLESLQPYRNQVDIIIADGGSTDGATTLPALSEKICTLLINTSSQKGLSVQYRIGLAYAMNEGYDAVIMMDGNGKDGAEAIPRFITTLEQGAHFIQGSRFLPGGEHKNTPLIRVAGMRFVFNPLMSLACGYHYTDAMNGFKAVSRTLLQDTRLQPFRDIFIRYNLQYYLNYMAPRLKITMTEIPVSRNYRQNVRVQSKIRGLRAWFQILGELLTTITGQYNVKP